MVILCKLFLCFIIFSFLGWCLEVTYGLFCLKKFVNRGFLIGPLCPIYGIGCLLIYLLLNKYSNDPIVLFFMTMVICSLLEYFASYILEKIFKVRWWDYNTKKFNINGRICLEMAVPFGILGLLVVYVLFPFALNILGKLPNLALYIIASILLVIFTVDLILSFNIILKFKNYAFKAAKDSTEEISRFVRETISSKSKLIKRLVDSFPDFQLDFDKIKNRILMKK